MKIEKLKPCPFCGMKLMDYYEDGRKAYHPYADSGSRCILQGNEWWVQDNNFIRKWQQRRKKR